MRSRLWDILALAGFLVLSAIVAAVGGGATAASVSSWYPTLDKPFFNPPDLLFGPVWTILYTMMAVAAWRIWRSADPSRIRALFIYGVQLALNLAWPLIFFGLRQAGAAIVVIVVLLIAVVATIRLFYPIDRIAAWLLLPYLAWIAFATALNAAIWLLN